ncbi:MAG: hypothetical protein IJX77_10180 [Ruminococcus sp.]|nr:hypothetical protein [Ruminococcus sp.]
MKHYILRITDAYDAPRVVTVRAESTADAFNSVEISDGEKISECVEIK